MNQRIAAGILCLFAAAALTASAADTKIGAIDLRKVFDGYYKTKQADASLKDEAATLDKERQDLVDTYKKGEDDYRKLIERASDQAIASTERDKSKQAAEKKLMDLKELEQSVSQFDRSARAKLNEKQRRVRDRILQEIRDAINAKAKSSGFTMVVDTAAESANNTPIYLYHSGENDITDEILAQLNAAAPAEAAAPKEEKKDK